MMSIQADLLGPVLLGLVLAGVLYQLVLALQVRPDRSQEKPLPKSAPVQKAPDLPQEIAQAAPTLSWSERLRRGLGKTRSSVWSRLGQLVENGKLSADEIEGVEELLYSSDMSPSLVQEIVAGLEDKAGKEFSGQELKRYLFAVLRQKMAPWQSQVASDLLQFSGKRERPQVVMIVGVNGAGKTTTIGKLATKLTRQGAKVFVGACDTFRAAAVDQLAVWCERAGATMVRAQEGGDPSGVAYETLQQAIAAQADYCLIDTAGRLHTKTNLMDELRKNKKVLGKLDPTAPQHTLLVIDAITGQNAMRQATEFHKALTLTGLIFTKCDGSSKAGNAVSIVESLQVPITYIGVGEAVEDLDIFQLDEFLRALLGLEESERSLELPAQA